jgi:iron complex outermembrane receptor protein
LSGKSLPLRKTSFWSHIHIGTKQKSSDVSGNYLIKKLHAGNIKVFVSYVGFQSVDTLVNLDGDQVLNFALKHTDQLQEVSFSQYAEQIDFGTKD